VRRFRIALTLFLAIWLPLQATVSFAMRVQVPSPATMVGSIHDHSIYQRLASSAQADSNISAEHGSSGDSLECNRCGLCALAHGGALPSVPTETPSIMPTSSVILFDNQRIFSCTLDTPQRPPRTFRA